MPFHVSQGRTTLLFPKVMKLHLFIVDLLLVGSGEILNNTAEEDQTLDGISIPEAGSGDGAFLPVTEEVRRVFIDSGQESIQ